MRTPIINELIIAQSLFGNALIIISILQRDWLLRSVVTEKENLKKYWDENLKIKAEIPIFLKKEDKNSYFRKMNLQDIKRFKEKTKKRKIKKLFAKKKPKAK